MLSVGVKLKQGTREAISKTSSIKLLAFSSIFFPRTHCRQVLPAYPCSTDTFYLMNILFLIHIKVCITRNSIQFSTLKYFHLKQLRKALSQRNKVISDSHLHLERVFDRVVVQGNGRPIPKSFSPQNPFL